MSNKFAGGNIFIFCGLLGFFISGIVFVINVILLRIIECRFIKYIKENDNSLWNEYSNFKPKQWGRFLYFIKTQLLTSDTQLIKIHQNALKYEKFASIAILCLITFFISMIVTCIITRG